MKTETKKTNETTETKRLARLVEELTNLSVGGLVLLAGVTALPFLAELHPYIDWFAHFRAIYIGFALAAFAVLAPQRRPMALAAVALVVVNGWFVAPYLAAPSPGAEPCEPQMKALAINAYGPASDHDALIALIERERPDVLFVSELRTDLKERIAKLYPEVVWQPQYEHFGLFTTFEVKGGRFMTAPNGRPTIEVVVETPTGPLRVIGAHPSAPGGYEASLNRNAMLLQIADAVRDSPEPVLLLGDLNTTMFSPHYTPLEEAGLVNARAGRGVQGTWPNYFPVQIPIDHVMTRDATVCNLEVGEDFGSDHLPLLATVQMGR